MGILDENRLTLKTKSIVLCLSNIISRSSMFPSPMQIHKPQCTAFTYKQCHQLPGLKTLIYEHESLQTKSPTPLIIHSYTIHQSSSSPPSSSSSDFLTLNTHSSLYSSWSSGVDDMLGTESGVYMVHSSLKMVEMDHKPNGYNNRANKRKRERTMPLEYPPPIPLLARTGNLPSHMPWILARYYGDGRLVLKEEKVKHHEYFEAYRENGRLILDLVSLDDCFRCHSDFEENNDDYDGEVELENVEFFQEYQELEKVEEEDEEEEEESDEADDDEDMINGKVNQALSVPEFCQWGETYGDPRKCSSLTYSGRIISESTSIVLSQC